MALYRIAKRRGIRHRAANNEFPGIDAGKESKARKLSAPEQDRLLSGFLYIMGGIAIRENLVLGLPIQQSYMEDLPGKPLSCCSRL
ncbi:hypothetical protein J27TS7_46090 [Paenibacillus dendritiformis]|nr:hypothetical protein J27TS7_46090 [Paenibacillus dendritiformis]